MLQNVSEFVVNLNKGELECKFLLHKKHLICWNPFKRNILFLKRQMGFCWTGPFCRPIFKIFLWSEITEPKYRKPGPSLIGMVYCLFGSYDLHGFLSFEDITTGNRKLLFAYYIRVRIPWQHLTLTILIAFP